MRKLFALMALTLALAALGCAKKEETPAATEAPATTETMTTDSTMSGTMDSTATMATDSTTMSH